MQEMKFVGKPMKPIRIAWYSPTEFSVLEELPPDFELFLAADPVLAGKTFDLIVLDIRAFESLGELHYTYTTTGFPAVLLLETLEQETAALSWLKGGDEICQWEVIQQQIILRLRRSILYSQQGQVVKQDALTGITNRHGLEDYGMTLFALQDARDPFCLIYLDLDQFKLINDQFGHVAGDQILIEVGELLQQSALGAGIIARIGGDEFVIIIQGNLDQGFAFAEFLRTQIESYEFKLDQTSICHITASFGVAAASDYDSFEELLQEADRCVYAAKGAGRNRVVTAEAFDESADVAGQDVLIADFENRIQVTAQRMIGGLVLKARQLAKQYRTEADRDGLTGIFNRRYLDRLLVRELERSRTQSEEFALMLIDLDHFGEVNRTYGFPTGDRTLKLAAEVFQCNVRAVDWVARYGGEEFCIVMPNTNLAAGCQVAERIRAALSSETVIAYDGRRFQITASIGVVELMPEDVDCVALFQRASDKVRQAKKAGRNQIQF